MHVQRYEGTMRHIPRLTPEKEPNGGDGGDRRDLKISSVSIFRRQDISQNIGNILSRRESVDRISRYQALGNKVIGHKGPQWTKLETFELLLTLGSNRICSKVK
ncbi:hypothetical protein FRC03_004324 [Tulasnella sp. 419]|nr:hypothetical protein FRC03_004324 [Tulasnella sp. 419]